MKVTVIEKEKNDRSRNQKLIVTIYENDYKTSEHDRNVSYPLIDKYSALVRFEFIKNVLKISFKKQSASYNNIVRLFVKCDKLDYSDTVVCTLNWSDWISIGKLPHNRESSASDGKVHLVKIHMNICELRNKTFRNLLDDKCFYDVYLVSDENVPANVAMHRAVLAAHSSKFKSMLLGEMKGALDVKIKIKDTDHQTLLDLRAYIYLGILPDKDLIPLLEVAKTYHFENLLKDCIFELVNAVNPNNLLRYRSFAINNEIPELLDALHQITSDELAKTAYRLEMLKVSQDQGKACVKNTNSTKKTQDTQKKRK